MQKLPKLPYGEGSFSYHNDLICYKKRIKLSDGTFKTKAVYAKTTQECMQKMQEFEHDLKKKVVSVGKKILCDEMYEWARVVKKPQMKEQSYQRLESTIRNQIEPTDIGHTRISLITSDDVQKLISNLNDNNYSKSTIKKAYDALNAFFRYASAKYKIDNPMLLVVMPTIKNVNKETREIVWFEKEDIEKFVREASATWNTGNPKYQGSLAYAANIYMGMRIGELLALKWEDIDFDNNTVYVCKTLVELQRDNKTIFEVQESTKRDKNRYIPLNSKAKDLLLKHRKQSTYILPDNYVISTRTGKTTTSKNASDTIKKMCENGGLDVITGSTHVLRHSCASLYFSKHIPIETICQILGNTREVCEQTYVHFYEESLKEAAQQIVPIIEL